MMRMMKVHISMNICSHESDNAYENEDVHDQDEDA